MRDTRPNPGRVLSLGWPGKCVFRTGSSLARGSSLLQRRQSKTPGKPQRNRASWQPTCCFQVVPKSHRTGRWSRAARCKHRVVQHPQACAVALLLSSASSELVLPSHGGAAFCKGARVRHQANLSATGLHGSPGIVFRLCQSRIEQGDG